MKKDLNTFVKSLLIFFFSFTVSCDNKKDDILPTIIPLASTVGNYNILNLSEFVTEIKYIPLETNDSVLIGQKILNIIYEDEEILVLDVSFSNKNNCYLFDNNGKFSCKIGEMGQGPNDYLHINSISKLKNLIYLMDWNKILIYNSSGNLVKNINLQSNKNYNESSGPNIIPLKKETFVANVISVSNYYPTAYLFENNLSMIKTTKEYPHNTKYKKQKTAGYSSSELGIIYSFKDDVRIFRGINDTIFTIGQNTEIKEAFILEMGKYRTPLSYYEANFDDKKNYDGKFISLVNIYESLHHLFISFNFGNYALEPFEATDPVFGGQYIKYDVYGVFEKSTGGLSLMRQPIKGKFGFKNNIDNGPVIWPHYITSNNELVTYISPEEFIEYYEKTENPSPRMTEIAKKLKIDDNPIVIIAKLKK